MTDEPARADATGLAEMIRRGELSPTEAVQAAIARIEALDPQVNAVIHRTFEKALEAAASPDLPDGPYRGVPFLLKDLWPASAGDPYHMGVRALREAAHVEPSDSNLVTAYRRAGFVIVGRTNTPELGLVATTEPLAYGPTRNPWDLERGAGGSSGGSAAAVAAGMVPAANASDGGGSIRIPAAMCGLVGLKPSRGRVSMGPAQEEWGLSVQHVVSHSVRDCAGILDATAYPFPGDGVIAPPPSRPWREEVRAETGGLRIGLLPRSLSTETDPSCEAAARFVAGRLEALGHRVEEAHPAGLDRQGELSETFAMMWTVGCRATLTGLGELLGRELTEADVESGTWMLAQMGDAYSGGQVVRGERLQGRFRRDLATWWDDGWDLLLTPTTASPPPLVGELVPSAEDPSRGFFGSVPYAAFTSVFNVTGQPAISLPGPPTPEGLPVGVQLVAAYGREDLLLRVAGQLEVDLDWAATRAPLHP